MAVSPPKPNALVRIFGQPKVLIRVIHSRPLPGSPRYAGEPVESLVEFALDEGSRYREGGFHGLIVENHEDLPFAKPEQLSPEITAVMAVITQRVRRLAEVAEATW